MAEIDEDLKAFLESDVAMVVGTRDSELTPEVVMGWGPRVCEGGREVELFVDRAKGQRTLANLRDNRLLAITCTSPITYRSVQLKGWCIEIGDPVPDDEPWVAHHREAFSESARARGLPAHVTRNLWSRDVVKLRLLVEERYDQTPGPGAGKKL
jgi:hypothetical protein